MINAVQQAAYPALSSSEISVCLGNVAQVQASETVVIQAHPDGERAGAGRQESPAADRNEPQIFVAVNQLPPAA
jgi:hypothetical protein